MAAASDLQPLQEPLAQAFQKLTGTTIRWVSGASGILARQVKAGAPYDAILAANTQYIDDLRVAGRIEPESVRTYALGRLGFWSARGLRWEDLRSGRVGRLAIANPAHAPYGAAAKQALEKAGLWAGLDGRLVYGENVRQAWQYAATGNADAVITAWSLVRNGGTLVDPSLYSAVRQGAGVVRGSPNAAQARRFLDFLTGPEGQAILGSFGFMSPR